MRPISCGAFYTMAKPLTVASSPTTPNLLTNPSAPPQLLPKITSLLDQGDKICNDGCGKGRSHTSIVIKELSRLEYGSVLGNDGVSFSGIVLNEPAVEMQEDREDILNLDTENQHLLGKLLLAKTDGKERSKVQSLMLDAFINQLQGSNYDLHDKGMIKEAIAFAIGTHEGDNAVELSANDEIHMLAGRTESATSLLDGPIRTRGKSSCDGTRIRENLNDVDRCISSAHNEARNFLVQPLDHVKG